MVQNRRTREMVGTGDRQQEWKMRREEEREGKGIEINQSRKSVLFTCGAFLRYCFPFFSLLLLFSLLLFDDCLGLVVHQIVSSSTWERERGGWGSLHNRILSASGRSCSLFLWARDVIKTKRHVAFGESFSSHSSTSPLLDVFGLSTIRKLFYCCLDYCFCLQFLFFLCQFALG